MIADVNDYIKQVYGQIVCAALDIILCSSIITTLAFTVDSAALVIILHLQIYYSCDIVRII